MHDEFSSDFQMILTALANTSDRYRDMADDNLVPDGYSRDDYYWLAYKFEELRKQMIKEALNATEE